MNSVYNHAVNTQGHAYMNITGAIDQQLKSKTTGWIVLRPLQFNLLKNTLWDFINHEIEN